MKKQRSKVLKVRRSTMSNLKTPTGEACYSMLEKYMPSKFKEELLREDALESIEWFVHAPMAIRSLNSSFLLLKDFSSGLIGLFNASKNDHVYVNSTWLTTSPIIIVLGHLTYQLRL